MDIIVLKGNSHVGKTTVLNILRQKLLEVTSDTIIDDRMIDFLERTKGCHRINVAKLRQCIAENAKGNIKNDFYIKVKIKGKIVVVFSMGDYISILRILIQIEFQVDILIFAFNTNHFGIDVLAKIPQLKYNNLIEFAKEKHDGDFSVYNNSLAEQIAAKIDSII